MKIHYLKNKYGNRFGIFEPITYLHIMFNLRLLEMKANLKTILINIVSVLIFITVPTMLVLMLVGYDTYGEYCLYSLLILAIPYYLLNASEHQKTMSNLKQ